MASAADCNHSIFDSGGYLYDFEAVVTNPFEVHNEYGAPSDGGSNGPAESPPGPVKTEDSWDDWGDVFVYSVGSNFANPTVSDKYLGEKEGCTFTAGGQEIAYPFAAMHGLEVQHRWFVDPGTLHGGRILTVLRNPGAAPAAVDVVQGDASAYDDLGSDSATASRATSDGSNVFSANSLWGVSSDNATTDSDPALAHVWDGAGGAVRANEVVLGGGASEKDVLYWAWKNVTVAPGETKAFISYEIQNADPSRATSLEVAGAVAQAQAREAQPLPSLYTGMSAAEIAGTQNWKRPDPTAAIAPVASANAAKPVVLNGAASIGAAGLSQCTIASYAWKADDGKTGTGPTFSHLFTAGRHKATLTVANNCGGAPQSSEVKFKVAKGFKLGKAKPDPKTGTVKLKVTVLGPGKLTLKGKGIEKRVKSFKKAGKATLTVEAKGKTLAALLSSGTAKAKVTVTFSPKGGKGASQAKTITLKKSV